ncbi:MAG: hypothetical protein ACRDA4_02870 [Filifactoraceae bacterium]
MLKTSKKREAELKKLKELEAKKKRAKAAKGALTVGAIGAGVAGIAAFLKTEKGQETLDAVYDKANDAVTIVKKYTEVAVEKANKLVKSSKDEELFYVEDEDEIVISKEFDEDGNEISKGSTIIDGDEIKDIVDEKIEDVIEKVVEVGEEISKA